MKHIPFRAGGGPITVEVQRAFQWNGSYVLRLWENNSNGKAMPDQHGHFANEAEDTFQLPLPVNANEGRIVEAFVTLVRQPKEKAYAGRLLFFQDGTQLGEEALDGETEEPAIVLDLFARLVAQ